LLTGREGANVEESACEQFRSRHRLSLRVAGTVAVVGAMMGLVGMGTASADPAVQPDAVPSAVGQSTEALVHHVEMYHLQQPTWEVTSLVTDPKSNYEVHHQMLDGMTDPLVNTLP
jgi:hypothetical protein